MTETSTPDRSTTQRNITQRVSKYWRSIDQLENSEEFQEFMHREFPQSASELPEGISRRRWIQLMGASFSLAAVQGCRWQTEEIAPFAERPEGYIPGSHTKFATSVELAGAPRHLLVTCYDGRPIKIDGNPDHPAGGSGSDCYSQAATLSLYDPDRQASLLERTGKETFAKDWGDFEAYARERVEELVPKGGEGLAILMAPTSSLSVTAALENLIEKLPQTRLFSYEPISRDSELAGAEVAFGKQVRTHYKLADADVIATFDADPLIGMPESVAMAREYAERREPDEKKNEAGMNRLYSVESQFSTTGAAADHRFAVKSGEIPSLLAELRDRIAGAGEEGNAGGEHDQEHDQEHDETVHAAGPSREEFLSALVEDLVGAKGRSVVIVGRSQPAEAHAIGHEINRALEAVGETVTYTDEPALAQGEDGPVKSEALTELLGAIAAKKVDTVLILGGNPIYDAPSNLRLAEELADAPHTIHLSQYDDETSRACRWSLPQTHPLEAWGDVSAWDGTVSVAQPLVQPLLGGRSALELLALFADGPGVEAKQLVREAVAGKVGDLDDAAWNKLLHDGYAENSAAEPADAALVRSGFEAPAAGEGDLEVVFVPSSSTYDGRFANNGWLQETPDFVTKLTWDNAAIINPNTAKDQGVSQGELVTISAGDQELDLPVFIQPGQAEGSIGVALGYGRTAAGRVGGMVIEGSPTVRKDVVVGLRGNWLPPVADPIGHDSYKLRTSDSMDRISGVEIKGLGRDYTLATTQDHHAIDELGLKEISQRSELLIREASLETYEEHSDFAKHIGPHTPDVELWNELSHDDNRAWGMAIDLNKCIGCNACSVACQAENNVPVVGKDQVARGREMHWIRIDRYFRGPVVEEDGAEKVDFSNPSVSYQPVACQHCETAPCEQVCPVAATIHSDEGLNDMTYNRCIGTRYCANNCPFKVRRFNFFNYTKRFESANNELMTLVNNPEVTVRARGVMEKCTYCTQRISAGRIDAKSENRAIRDGDIKTACQEACPTSAIVFGDLNDEKSEVAAWHANDRSYGMLEGLRLKPRTKYLARIRNPHPKLEKYMVLDASHKDGHQEHGHGGGGHDDGGHDGHGHKSEHSEENHEKQEA